MVIAKVPTWKGLALEPFGESIMDGQGFVKILNKALAKPRHISYVGYGTHMPAAIILMMKSYATIRISLNY